MNAKNTAIHPKNDNVLIFRDSHLKLVNGNHYAAMALNQTIYWNEKMGRQFWKTDQDFADELHISIHKFRRIKATLIKPLPFIKITLKGIPATTNYEVDFAMLNEILAAQSEIPDTPTPQITDDDRLCKVAQSSISLSAQTNTETIPKITKKKTTPVVVNLDIFEEKQKPIIEKSLSQLTQAQQVAVMAVMMVAIQTSNITNKVGYLRSLVNAAINGTFTPVEPTEIPLTAAQRLANERKRKEEEDQRHKVSNEDYFKALENLSKKNSQLDNVSNSTQKAKFLSGIKIKLKA